MTIRLLLLSVLILLTSGCSGVKIEDFRNTTPELKLEEYFNGQVRAWGMFQGRDGMIKRQFVVDITGKWDGQTLTLDEQFRYRDGERQQRIWHILKRDDHHYEGRADDVAGVAQGRVEGQALNWRYDLNLVVDGTTYRVHFNDWMFMHEDNVLVNRATMSKWGIRLGEVTLFFRKES